MLVVTRKKGESILIGNDIEISVSAIENGSVKLAVKAPKDVQILRKELSKLDDRDREIIVLRYGLNGKEEMTQKDLAERLQISQSYISRIEKKVLKRLKNIMKV